MSVRFKRSYRDRKQAVAKRKKFIIKVFSIILAFQIIYTFFFTTIEIGSVSMEPGLEKGHMLVYSPSVYGYRLEMFDSRLPEISSPQRGDLIVFTPPYIDQKKGIIQVLGSILKFLSFNKINIESIGAKEWENPFMIKRVIAIPGDTVKMENHKVYIKSDKSDYFLSEFEVIGTDYDIHMGQLPEGWLDTLPFSGNKQETYLNDNEYFVLGDNRMESSDSMNWGLLNRDRIEGKIVMQYWPLNKISFNK